MYLILNVYKSKYQCGRIGKDLVNDLNMESRIISPSRYFSRKRNKFEIT